jgi:hypothetical protein
MELKTFCTAKEMVTRLKRQHIECENIVASYTTDKGLITRIFIFLLNFFLFICAYNVWVISPPFPHPLLYPSCPLPYLPNSSLSGRNYFAFTSNFVEDRI